MRNEKEKNHKHEHDKCCCDCDGMHVCECEDDFEETVVFMNKETGEELSFDVLWEIFYEDVRYVGLVESDPNDNDHMIYFAKEVGRSLKKSNDSKSNELDTNVEYELVSDEHLNEELYAMYKQDWETLEAEFDD